MDETMREALNDQLNYELYSGYIYLSMGAWAEAQGLPGMAQWMRTQWGEEVGHALRFFGYIAERGARVDLRSIQAPPKEWDSALNAFEVAYHHEQGVTARIKGLAEKAAGLGDHATVQAMQWFVTEQIEEEENVSGVIASLRTLGSTPEGLAQVDHQLGRRGS